MRTTRSRSIAAGRSFYSPSIRAGSCAGSGREIANPGSPFELNEYWASATSNKAEYLAERGTLQLLGLSGQVNLDPENARRVVRGPGSQSLQHLPDGTIGFERVASEAGDAVLQGHRAQGLEQEAAHSAALVVVDDGDRGLSHLGLARDPHVPRHPDPRLAGGVRVERHPSEVIDVVDLGEESHLAVRELLDRGHEASVPRLRREPAEAVDQEGLVCREDGGAGPPPSPWGAPPPRPPPPPQGAPPRPGTSVFPAFPVRGAGVGGER